MKALWLLLFAFAIFCSTASAQFALKKNLNISNDDPVWGETITVTYVPPDTSVYARNDNTDTVYCAAIVYTAWGEKGGVVKMTRKNTATDEAQFKAKYEAQLPIPDSSYKVRLEICIRTDRVPFGIGIFTCKQPNGFPPPGGLFTLTENTDSAFTEERKHYPWNYTAYLKAFDTKVALAEDKGIPFPDSAKRAYLEWLRTMLLEKPDTTMHWYFALADIESRRKNGDSASLAALKMAATHPYKSPLFYDALYWSSFFAPKMSKSGVIMPYVKSRAIIPLVLAFPHSDMAKMWLQRAAFDSLLDAAVYKKVVQAWQSSQDVDLTKAIASALLQKRTGWYDPQAALLWIQKAELSNRTGSGFYSGENIFGSMGRWDAIAQIKSEALCGLGKADEAIRVAQGALASAKEQYQKNMLGLALAMTYWTKGNIDAAERALGIALASSSRRTSDVLDSLYANRKKTGESKDDYVSRITKEYGSSIELPPLHSFNYQTLDGVKGSIAEHKGKVVVLDFWFVSCPGCIMERNSLNTLVDEFKDNKNVVFLSVCLDGETYLRNHLKNYPRAFPVVPDGQEICDNLGIQGFPTHVILNSEGKTVLWEMGGDKETGAQLKRRINELLQTK